MSSSSIGLSQEAADKPLLRLVADSGDSQSRTIAIGMSLLANSKIDEFDVEIAWAGVQDDPYELMQQEDSDLGLVSLAEFDPNEFSVTDDLSAVMKVWRALDQANKTDGDGNPGSLLVAKSSTDAALIYSFIEAVQSDSIVLKAADLDTKKLAPSVAMVDLPLRLHQGAQDYLATTEVQPATPSTNEPEAIDSVGDTVEQEAVLPRPVQEGVEPQTDLNETSKNTEIDRPEQTPTPSQVSRARSYILYFDTDEAAIGEAHINSVARACRYAAKLSRAKFVISGQTDTAEATSYNNDLAKRRASVVADAIRNDPNCRGALSAIELGDAELALKTGDGVSEPLDRKVTITILPEQ